ncbi:SDR family oxidoreductase [Zavarzinia compransoris]|uniref:Short-chain dehydrogenase n=1 Tax=Zavarzinia compransoris TaxID=1264899 RepID=A0A317E6B5_9PROT|nr:SDR family oxidoreductase [Zavarzinia compransoris]PWR20575.1 short-chain dehydrogenase [Zavarzinia compransoris]TDP43779.1 NADP-dependent 3-hydroxy acid dehydrogenase YdfG [Zavarzinia compransoris]
MSKAVFITGAARGIGAAIARRFAAEGYYLGLVDLDAEGVARLAADLGANRCFHAALDVTDFAAYERVLGDFTEAAGGRLDVLVNNAGIAKFGAFETIAPAFHGKTIDVNLKGVVNGFHAALPHLKKTPGATVVSLCSASALYGTPGLAVYSATKFAVRALTEALAQEFAPFGIKVTDIMPGFVATDMVHGQSAAAGAAVKKMGGIDHRPEDIADLAYRAVTGDKVHWPGNATVRFGLRLAGLFPGLMRRMMRPMAQMH